MATLPIIADDSNHSEHQAAAKPELQLLHPLRSEKRSVTVNLGNHMAEIIATQHFRPRKITYRYTILDLSGTTLFRSGDGFLSVTGVVEKAAQHLEVLWNTEQY